MAATPVADWLSAQPYSALHHSGRHCFAWEWLRRSADYQAASVLLAPDDPAASFGLHRFEKFCLALTEARPVWRADADPFVVSVVAASADGEADLFAAARLARFATMVGGSGGVEHWLFSDGFRSVRLDVTGTLANGPVRLEHRIGGLSAARPAIKTVERLIGLARHGHFTSSHFPRERRAKRWALTLRVHDALAAGASHREIAAAVFGLDAGPGWKVDALSCWSRVRRLQEAARRCAGADPRLWLAGAFP